MHQPIEDTKVEYVTIQHKLTGTYYDYTDVRLDGAYSRIPGHVKPEGFAIELVKKRRKLALSKRMRRCPSDKLSL